MSGICVWSPPYFSPTTFRTTPIHNMNLCPDPDCLRGLVNVFLIILHRIAGHTSLIDSWPSLRALWLVDNVMSIWFLAFGCKWSFSDFVTYIIWGLLGNHIIWGLLGQLPSKNDISRNLLLMMVLGCVTYHISIRATYASEQERSS